MNETEKVEYYDYENSPKVQANMILAFNNTTHGKVYFNRDLTIAEQRFFISRKMNFANTKYFLSKNQTSVSEAFFSGLVPDQIKNVKFVLSLVKLVRKTYIEFNTKRMLSVEETISFALGLDILNQATPLRAEDGLTAIESCYIQVRNTDNNITRITLVDDDFMLTKGFLVPVWSESSSSLRSYL